MQIQIEDIQLDKIRPSEMNPREEMGDIQGLADSILEIGQLQPLTVVNNGEGYEIVAGERRWTAMNLAAENPAVNLKTAKCYVFESMDDANKFLAIMGDNAYRKDFTDTEKSRGVQQMLMLGVDPIRVGKAVGEDGEALRKVRRVLPKLNAEAQKMTIEQAVRVARYEDDPEAIEEINKAGDRLNNVLWSLDYKHDAADKAIVSVAEIEKSGAKLFTKEEHFAIPYGKRTSYDESSYKSFTKKGCGCDGFSAYIDSDGTPTYFCTKPENHSKSAKNETPAQAKKRVAAEEARKAFEADDDRRASFFSDFLRNGLHSIAFEMRILEFLKIKYEDELNNLDDDFLPATVENLIAAATYDYLSMPAGMMNEDQTYHDNRKQKQLNLWNTLEAMGYTLTDTEEKLRTHYLDIIESRHPTTQVQNNTEDIESDEYTEEDDIYSID